MPRRQSLGAGLVLSACLATGLAAQQVVESPARLRPNAPAALFTRPVIVAASGITAASLLLMTVDREIAGEFGETSGRRIPFLDGTARMFNSVGDPGTAIASLAIWSAGRLSGNSRLTDIGAHGVASVALASLTTGVLKGLAGRQRPSVDAGDDDDFRVGAGFRSSSNTSFPSGHTTVAFAFAATIGTELRRSAVPGSRIIEPVLYLAAGGVGIARMYSTKHWASDVALGAGIGVLASHVVDRWGHAGWRPFAGLDATLRPAFFSGGPYRTVPGWAISLR